MRLHMCTHERLMIRKELIPSIKEHTGRLYMCIVARAVFLLLLENDIQNTSDKV